MRKRRFRATLMTLGQGVAMRKALPLIAALACLFAVLAACSSTKVVPSSGVPRPPTPENQKVVVFPCWGGMAEEECAAAIGRPFDVLADITRVQDARDPGEAIVESLLSASCRYSPRVQTLEFRAPMPVPATFYDALPPLLTAARKLGANGLIILAVNPSGATGVTVNARAIYIHEEASTPTTTTLIP